MPGTEGNDTFDGSAVGETLEGLGGSDTIGGLDGNDTILGGDGADALSGGDGNDIIYGHGLTDNAADAGQIYATRVASGLSLPVFATSAPGDPNRLFVIEKETGIIKILHLASGTMQTFLDIPQSEMTVTGSNGLLGLAFHPDYASNGHFYVYVVNAAGNTEVREYHRSADDPDVADPGGDVILTFATPASNHTAGWLGFGPDGYLYIASGDAGGQGDVNNHAQNLDGLLGKILRIDVDGDDFGSDSNRDYAIPIDNPFAEGAGAPEIWALGLRNPWRASFDSLTGDFYIADVGQNRREEINFQDAGSAGGQNYGWHVLEGTLVYDDDTPGNPSPTDPSLVAPVLEYEHVPAPDGGRSITGGYVYRGPAPGAEGLYFFADFISGQIWTVRVVDGQAIDFFNRTAQIVADAGAVDSIVSFATDGAGNLYVIGIDGEIHRLDPTAAAGDASDTLFGNAGDDTLSGGFGNDTLDGGVGADVLRGGTGNDKFIVSSGDDTFSGGIGTDVLDFSAITQAVSIDLASKNPQGVFGGSIRLDGDVENVIGTAFSDTISGTIEANRIDGGKGGDIMAGGSGNDIYVVDTMADIINESGGNDNADRVMARVSYVLDPDVAIELLTTNGGTGTNPIHLTGNGFYQEIIGNNGANVLSSKGGGDLLRGLGGNDTYRVYDAADTIRENAIHGAADRVAAAVDYVLGSAVFVEIMTTNGSTGVSGIDLTGNELAQTITGNAGNNRLDGKEGGDRLAGLGGRDSFVFSSTLGPGNVDTVTDFNVTDDVIRLDDAIFTELTTGTLAAGAFAANATGMAGDASDRIVFETDTGRLFYDADGNGTAFSGIHFATLSGAPTITSADFVVI